MHTQVMGQQWDLKRQHQKHPLLNRRPLEEVKHKPVQET